MFIYKITNTINDKIYIGQTVNDIKLRFRDHCKPSTSKKSIIGYAIQKHGKENFIITEINGANSQEELNYQEWLLVHQHNSLYPNGYNLKEGGDASGKLTKEARLKLSKKVIDIETGKTWESGKACSEDLGCPYSTLLCRLNGTSVNKTSLRYVGREHVCKKPKDINLGNSKKIVDIKTKQTWINAKICAEELGLNHGSLMNRLKGLLLNTTNLRYVGKEGICKKAPDVFNNLCKRIINTKTKTIHKSIAEAAKNEGLHRTSLSKWLRTPRLNKSDLIYLKDYKEGIK